MCPNLKYGGKHILSENWLLHSATGSTIHFKSLFQRLPWHEPQFEGTFDNLCLKITQLTCHLGIQNGFK